ncbi:GAF domain-containing protein [Caldithrix abyssi DSM 13497]|uniref:GAF domain-containing protein n=1 Tax=Caldithrix abyssi DSM 13497 TaxID=880073 RepID=H1XWT4_CALAY|nr:GAF domain-containing protein [Caldithrix abyssi]APF19133.1 GAF domain-containing protein [Caldithrix abyssi DSM 13497]EHO43060.1 GAF domain-containing protein [Caldithrix abyssi DSM 13497]
MIEVPDLANLSKEVFYELLYRQARAMVEDERDAIANMANLSALLFYSMENINWAGFYLLKREDELVLGPFQGKPACVRIKVGSGVCGTAVKKEKTLIVDDVHQFPGHIACDSASNSEIVVPMIKNGKMLGVLDIDSPMLKRFSEADRIGLERIVKVLLEYTDF